MIFAEITHTFSIFGLMPADNVFGAELNFILFSNIQSKKGRFSY